LLNIVRSRRSTNWQTRCSATTIHIETASDVRLETVILPSGKTRNVNAAGKVRSADPA
jgi:hypothetical protein